MFSILAVRAWIECTSNLFGQISQQLPLFEEFNRKFYRQVETDGFAAYMKCVTQHSANSTAADECVSRNSDRLLASLNTITEQADAKYQSGIELADSFDQCLPATQKKTKTEMANIINNLKTCVPQLNIRYDKST